jgi:hypothetical protein
MVISQTVEASPDQVRGNFSFVVPEREAYVEVAAGEEIHGANPNEEQGFGQEIIQRFAAT